MSRRFVTSFVSRSRSVRGRATIDVDYLRFRRRAARVFPPPGVTGPRVLVVSLTDWPYQLKLEGVLAAALQLRGAQAVALVPPRAANARRYLRACGVESFAELATYADAELDLAAAAAAEPLLHEELTVRRLKEVQFRGASIGRFALSTLSRNLHEGSVDLDSATTRHAARELLHAGVRSTLAAERLLDDVAPELVLFNERNYADQGPLSDLALRRGLNVIQLVSAFQDDAFVFKRFTVTTRALHPRSLSDESWKVVQSLPWGEQQERELGDEFAMRYGNRWALSRRLQGWTRPQPPDEIIARLALDRAKPTAVVFSHVLWDANMFYGEDLFEDQEAWFIETVRAACANPHVNWILKLHPANVWKLRRDGVEAELGELVVLREHLGRLPGHVAVLPPDTDISTRSVFELASWGITIRGSVGIELPCFGVPVLTAGTGFYAGRGFTIDSGSAAEYLERLRRIQGISALSTEQTQLARRHAHALFRLRPTRFTSFESRFGTIDNVGHPLDQNLVLRLRSRAEFEHADDVRRFADWAIASRELDYLALAERSETPLPSSR